MRRTTIRRIFALLSLSAVVMTSTVIAGGYINQPAYAYSEGELDSAKKELEEAQRQVEKYTNRVNEISGNVTDLQSYISEVDGILGELAARIYNLQVQIENKRIEIADKQDEIATVVAAIRMCEEAIDETEINLDNAINRQSNQYDAMKLRIQYMYENGDVNFLEILFSSDSMIDFLNNAEYIQQISKYDRDKMIEYNENRLTIEEYLAELENQNAVLNDLQVKLEGEERILEDEEATLQALLDNEQSQQATYNNILTAKNNELANAQNNLAENSRLKALAEQEQKEAQERYDTAKREYAEWLATLAAKGDAEAIIKAKLAEINITGFTWPLPGYNRITSEFSYNRVHPVFGYVTKHDGMDISGYDVNCKPIVAAYSGKVILAQSYYGYGNCVKIDHGGSIQTLYAHCSSILVSVGQQVNAGDTIALVGSTGNSTGPHLHFSIIVGGEFVNPRDYIRIP